MLDDLFSGKQKEMVWNLKGYAIYWREVGGRRIVMQVGDVMWAMRFFVWKLMDQPVKVNLIVCFSI